MFLRLVLDLGPACADRWDRQGGSTHLSGFLGAPLGLIRDKGKLGSEAEMGGMSELFRNRDGERTSPPGHVGKGSTSV